MTTTEPQKYLAYPSDPWYHKYYYDPRKVAFGCHRCSVCKWIDPLETRDARFAKVCPSHYHYLFDAYSSQGRMDIALGLIDGKLKYEDSAKLLDVYYQCNTCGGCDASCKRNRDMEPLRVMLDTRARLVEDGELLPQHMPVIGNLRKEDNTMMGRKADRGRWAEGLAVKDLTTDTAEVAFHAGCATCYDQALWPAARGAIAILQQAGVDVGIMGKDETCCGGKAFDMGYRGEFLKYAENNMDAWKNARVKTVVTACADGSYAMKRLYPEVGSSFEVLHIVELIDRLIQDGKLKFTREVPLTVTYHDPCHLGRRDTDRIYAPGQPTTGVYEPPRNILRSIPGINFVEMFRIKEYAWCCGAGGGVKEAYPDFSLATAIERLREAEAVGAEAIVSACPWCQRSFLDAVRETGDTIKVYDIVELVQQAI